MQTLENGLAPLPPAQVRVAKKTWPRPVKAPPPALVLSLKTRLHIQIHGAKKTWPRPVKAPPPIRLLSLKTRPLAFTPASAFRSGCQDDVATPS